MLNKTKRYVYALYGCLAYALPMLLLFAIKHDTYLTQKSAGLSFFGIILLVMIFIVFKNKLLNNTTISMIIAHLIIIVLLILPQMIIDELNVILFTSIFGLILSYIFARVERVYENFSYGFTEHGKVVNRTPLSDKQAWAEAYNFGVIKE